MLKREGSLVDYTNEVQVEIDYSDVDPELVKSGAAGLDTKSIRKYK